MSNIHDWGDKLIITLRSDGIRRHKRWCTNYRASDKFCSALCQKCIGSAFCESYTSKHEEEKPIFIHDVMQDYIDSIRPEKLIPDIDAPDKPETSYERKKIKYDEYYRLASYGDKLLNRTILFKRTPFIFKIGVVVDESFSTFTVEYGGKKITYDKKAAYRMNAVYIFTEIEVSEEDEST